MVSEAEAMAGERIAGVEWGQEAEGWGSIEGFDGGRRCCEGWKAWKGCSGGGGGGCEFLSNATESPQALESPQLLFWFTFFPKVP